MNNYIIREKEHAFRIKVGTMPYKELNYLIYKKSRTGFKNFILDDVVGQRYIGAGMNYGIKIEVNGIPGQDVGVFNGGSTIVVNGNAQDGVGNTMNDGFIIVHGNVGDIPGHMMRNGKIYIRGSAGFRAGIMMKEYGRKKPVIIIGERVGDYLGEYMAGGRIIVLGYDLSKNESPVGHYIGSGIFGGTIWIRGNITKNQLGKGSIYKEVKDGELEEILPFIEEYAEIFNLSLDKILSLKFWKVTKSLGRPFGKLYVPSNKIGGELFPLHTNLKSPCSNACPIGIPNQQIIKKIRDGEIKEAYEIIDDYTPFRYTCCGLSCPRFCEQACTRNSINDPVPIAEISKKYAPKGKTNIREEQKDERIAIIGGGPGGLSAAWHLARLGYKVDLFEKEKILGGKLTNNIPEERVPQDAVDNEISRIKALKINFRMNKMINLKNIKSMKEKYNAIILAIGLRKPKKIGFSGEDYAISSYYFMRSIRHNNLKNIQLFNKNVVIIGAGNVGMDVACESFKYGAKLVTVIDIKTPSAFINEIERAENLGAKIVYPRFIEKYENKKIYFKNDYPLNADLLIEAIGEETEIDFSAYGMIISKGSFTTNIPGVYIIGDAASPGYIADAIADGREIAYYLHGNFRGLSEIKRIKSCAPVVDKQSINLVYFQNKGIYKDVLVDKCASCGTCIQCDICIENCPHDAVTRIEETFKINLETCSGCGTCASLCPRGAITMVKKSDLFLEESSEGTKVETQTNYISCKK